MFSPSGWSLITSTLAPVAPQDPRGPTADAEPFAQSSTIRSPEASIVPGERLAMGDVARDAIAGVDDRPEPVRRRAGELVGAPDELLQLVLDRVVELQPVGVEDLEAVVLGRVVRRGHHDPGRVVAVGGEERQRGRRHDADDVDRHAQARRAGRDRGHEHVARAPRVLPDDDGAARPDEALRRRAAERERGRGLQVDVGDAADAVGAEQAWHG